jgi:O-antigen ligase
MIESFAPTLAFVKFLETWQIAIIGAVVLLITINLRFEWVLTITVFTLAMAEFNIGALPEYAFEWRMVRQFCRLIRWFLFLAMAIKGLGLAMRGGALVGGSHRVRGLAMAVLLVALASILYSDDRHLTAASCLMLALVFFVAFGVLWRVIDSRERVIGVALALYRAFWPLLLLSTIVWFVWELPRFGFLKHRFSGVFLNPNGLGVMAAVFFPVALWQYFRSEGHAGRRFLSLLIVICTFVAVLSSGSRSAFAGWALSTLIFLAYRYRQAFPVFAAIFALMLPVVIVLGLFDDAYDPEGTDDQIIAVRRLDPQNRLERWEEAVYLMTRAADVNERFLGYGYGRARFVKGHTIVGEGVWSRGAGLGVGGYDFHSSIISTWVELGIPGLLLVTLLILSILLSGYRFFQGSRTEDLPMVGVALFSALVVMICDSMVHGWLFSAGSGLSFIFWCYTALVIRATQFLDVRETQEEEPEPMPALRGMLTE